MTTTLIATWLLTYLLHSTILLCSALVVSRSMAGRNLAVQEMLLRAALIGGVLTATLQVGLGIAPLAGVFALDSAAQSQPAAVVSVSEATFSGSSAGTSTQTDLWLGIGWTTGLIVLWGVSSILAFLGVLRSVLDLKRLLQTRCFQPAGRLVENLARAMGLRKSVKLSTSKAIAAPFATGIRHPEICCPERVDELAREHRTSLFAHELAHLARRDPAWQLMYRLGEALFVLQPLNRLVRHRLEEIAEHLTDERAVACTGDRLGLARCLVVVAHWGISSRPGLPATALASGPRLDRRVKRLIAGTTDPRFATRWALPFVIALFVAAAIILPSVGAIPVQAETTASPVIEGTTWSVSPEASASDPGVAGARTWTILAERPAPAPPVPSQPEPAEPSAASPPPRLPVSEAAPRPAAVTELSARPQSAAAPEAFAATPPAARPEADEPPAPTVEPSPPTKPSPAEAPRDRSAEESARRRAERERERAVAREREHEERRRESEERARTRAEARAERYREQEVRAAEIEARTAERLKQLEIEREALREALQRFQSETQFMVQERTQAAAERSRALAREASAIEREASKHREELTEGQREEYRLKALQLRAEAEAQRRQAKTETIERARELSEKTRRIVAEAEAQRRKLEEMEQPEKD